MVPIIKGGKVVEVLEAVRNGKKVYFRLRESQNSIDFLEALVFINKNRLQGKMELGSSKGITGGAVASWDMKCKTITLVVGGFKETDPPIEKRETKCKFVWSNDQPGVTSPAEESNCAAPSGDCSDGEGGAGYPYPEEDAVEEKIDISDLKGYPCAYEIAQQLPYMDNDIATLLRDTFGKDNGIDVTFDSKSDVAINGHDGETIMIGDKTKFRATIYINQNVLSGSTQEFILATMYHEVVHAYLLFEWSNLGTSNFYAKYPTAESYDVTYPDGKTIKRFKFVEDIRNQNHNRMGPFINGLKSAILNFNPNYPPERAEALAMGGIIADNSMPKGYDKYNQHEKEGTTAALGTKCNK